MGSKKTTKKEKSIIEKMPTMSDEEVAAEMKRLIKTAREHGMPIRVDRFIVVHMTFDHDQKVGGWAHTHGMMYLFGLPELEIREIKPLMFLHPAGVLLNSIAQYMVDNQGKKEVKSGETLEIHSVMVKLVEGKALMDDEVEHYKHPVLRVIDNPAGFKCSDCEDKREH